LPCGIGQVLAEVVCYVLQADVELPSELVTLPEHSLKAIYFL
jgi:hypothetical protein